MYMHNIMNIINIEHNMNTKYIIISKETTANVTENSMNIVNIMNTNNIEKIINIVMIPNTIHTENKQNIDKILKT